MLLDFCFRFTFCSNIIAFRLWDITVKGKEFLKFLLLSID
jgi:hypothetical protein